MSRQWFLKSVALLAFIGTAAPFLSAQAPRRALPGTVNYVEGQVSIDGNPLPARQNGDTQVQPNQNLITASGKAEMLLTPGVFVRTGNNSDIRMASNGLANPAIEVVRGEAMIEVDQKVTGAQIEVLEHGATASILKYGLYRFDGDRGRIEVIDGKLRVTENGQSKDFGKGNEVVVNGEPLKSVGFDCNAEDDLYRWSSVRPAYLADANTVTAQSIYNGYGSYWGPDWYWDPYFGAWSWMPGDGFFYSPFGYPFFSPGYSIYASRFGFGRGFAGRTGVNMTPRLNGGALRGGGGFGGGGFHGGGGGGGRR
jgi:uncharacterized membrane protein YgcG